MINVNIIKLIFLCYILSFVYCANPGDINERINPFDPNGNNWFPPTVNIIEDTINGTIYNSVNITVKTSDQNGVVKFFNWIRMPDSIQTIDTITNFNDSIIIYDTIPVVDTIDIDTISYLDSIIYKKDADSVYYETGTDTVPLIIIDSNNYDTVFNITGSDTTYKHYKNEDSLYDVYKIFMAESLYVHTIIVNNPVIDSVYYLYLAEFSISTPDTFRFYITAIDNDGVKSEGADSVLVRVSDTSITDFF
jgi:hypothetical protein